MVYFSTFVDKSTDVGSQMLSTKREINMFEAKGVSQPLRMEQIAYIARI